MEINEAVAVIGAAIRQAVTDKDSNETCEHAHGEHKLGDCANRVIDGLMQYIDQQPDEITPGDLVEEFLRIANGG